MIAEHESESLRRCQLTPGYSPGHRHPGALPSQTGHSPGRPAPGQPEIYLSTSSHKTPPVHAPAYMGVKT